MTTASQPYLDPETVSGINNLEIRARQIVEGLISGRHRSPLHGQSIEFAQHREYAAGDELRHLDWKVWAKSDRLYVKQFEEETNLRATLLVDGSASMRYGVGAANKFAAACRLAAAVSYLLLRQQDAVGLITFDDALRREVPHRNARTHLRSLLQAMLTTTPQHKTDMEKVFRQVAESHTTRGMIVLISDLLADRESVRRGLRLFRHRRHDLVVFHVLHDDEMDFNFQGLTRFEGLEGPEALTCDPRALREEYLASLNRYLAELRRLCGQTGIDYRFLRSGESTEAVLAAFLHERGRR